MLTNIFSDKFFFKIFISVQISPSFPALIVAWIYNRVKHAEYYMQLPMDVGLDQLAAVMLFVGMLTITFDVLFFLKGILGIETYFVTFCDRENTSFIVKIYL